MFVFIFIISRVLPFYILPFCSLSSFCFNLKNSLYYFLSSRLVVMKFLSFHWSGKVFISPSFLENCLDLQYSCLASFFFPFSTLTISSYSLPAHKVSAEKSTDSFIGDPLYVMSFFFFLLLFSNFILWF